jgi:4-hydroxy-tetrahydrodipicolinate synthase
MKPGSTVALVTPFDTVTGQVDANALRRLLQYHVASGTDNVCILGTTGEASALSMTERELVINIAVSEVKGKLPIVVGTGSNNPSSTKSMTQQALDLGGDAALIVTPYYVKPPQRMLIAYMLEMVRIGLPVVVYNVPGRTGVDMTDDSIAIVAGSHENIIGVKDATGNLSRVNGLLSRLSKAAAANEKKFGLYSGDDATSVDFVLAGGTGCISVTANVAAAAMHQSMMAALVGDAATARSIDEPLQLLHRDLFCESNPIPVKYAVSKLWPTVVSDYCRPPLDRLLSQYQPVVDIALQRAGVLVL